MKKLVLVFSMLLTTATISAQAWNGKGDQKVQIGLSAWGNGTGITGTYDYGISEVVSLGAGANIYFSDYKEDSNFFVFGRANFHLQEALNLPSQWDIYPGVDLGLLGNTFGLGAHIGARYYFNDRIGAFAEIGNNGSIGVSINL